MSKAQTRDHSISYHLSRVLNAVGLSKVTVTKRQSLQLNLEKQQNIYNHLAGYTQTGKPFNTYFFGSQVEASSTEGLRSDFDEVLCWNDFCIIQNQSERRNGRPNLLVLQSGNIPAGYCRLQLLEQPRPQIDVHAIRKHLMRDDKGRVIVKNTFFHFDVDPTKSSIHGPAHTSNYLNGALSTDFVSAFQCNSVSKQVEPWIESCRDKPWPTADMLKTAEESGFFLVPVGHRRSKTRDLEWRVSPSLTERCLMHSMNITQLRCYVVLKMIKKEFIIPKLGESITSFHLKTTMFHCIANTTKTLWKEKNLLICIRVCLKRLLEYVEKRSCPNFLIPEENLFSGRVAEEQILPLKSLIKRLLTSENLRLFEIQCDQIGERLQQSSSPSVSQNQLPSEEYSLIGSCEIMQKENHVQNSLQLLRYTRYGYISTIEKHEFVNWVQFLMMELRELQINSDPEVVSSTTYLLTYLHSTFGSLLASECIRKGKQLSTESIASMKRGFDTDLMSGKLKYASALYCAGEIGEAATLLVDLEQQFDDDFVQPVCTCNKDRSLVIKKEFEKRICACRTDAEKCSLMAFHVVFTPHELQCCPLPLQFEMFSAAQEQIETNDGSEYSESGLRCSEVTFGMSKTPEATSRQPRTPEAMFGMSKTPKTILGMSEIPEATSRQPRTAEATSRTNNKARMDIAAVDAAVFLYFLMYITNLALGKRHMRMRALANLREYIMGKRSTTLLDTFFTAPSIIHVDTALNLLGQCLQMEGMADRALACYQISLSCNPYNLATKWLLGLHMYKQYYKPLMEIGIL